MGFPDNIVRGSLAVDPGVETGLVIAYLDDEGHMHYVYGSVTGTPAKQVLEINGVLNQMFQVHEVLIEKFELSHRTLKAGSDGLHTAEVYFGLKVFLEMGELVQDEGVLIPQFHYRPVDIKVAVTDAFMKDRGFWATGNKQHRDAMRLFLYHCNAHRDLWPGVWA